MGLGAPESEVTPMHGSSRIRTFELRSPESTEESAKLPIDLGHLRRYTLGDKALEDEILQLFLTQLTDTLAALRAAQTNQEWKVATHTLKGSSRAIGAWELGQLAQDAEALAQGGDAAARAAAIAGIEVAAGEVAAFVERAA